MTLHYWQYFVALDSDLASISRYVEFSEENMATYSIEFARLILSAGSEVDVLAKVLCNRHGLSVARENMDSYRDLITGKFPGFTGLEVRLPRYSMRLTPWSEWNDGKNPQWWRAYNTVKHRRHEEFAQANLRNALDAMAGLFVMVCYYNAKELRQNVADPWPKIFSLDPALNSRISRDHRTGYIIPDLPYET